MVHLSEEAKKSIVEKDFNKQENGKKLLTN
jgi:hypothetical protein